MADDVCDSWEDMLDDRILEKKLKGMKVDASLDDGMVDNINKDTNQVPNIKILKRPTQSSSSSAGSDGSVDISNGSNKTYDLNSFVNSEPFVPSSFNNMTRKYPQVTLEDNTRTQYAPQVKILRRPTNFNTSVNGSINGGKISPSKGGRSGNSAKSLEEREAEYYKARERILGSGTPTYDEDEANAAATNSLLNPKVSSPSSSTATEDLTCNLSPQNNSNFRNFGVDVHVVRLPHGPNGTRGFASNR